MKKLLPLLLVFAYLGFVEDASAKTTVNISNNGEGATSRVEVHNSVNSRSTTSTSVSNNRTDIRIESNGQVKEYHSDKAENINIQSDDGKSQVHVNNTGSTITIKPTSPASNSAEIEKKIIKQKERIQKTISDNKQEVKKKIEEAKEKAQQEQFGLLEFIKRIFDISWFRIK